MLLVALPLNASNELNNITILQLRGDYFFHILMFIPWMFFQKTTHFKAMHWLLPGLLFASVSEGLQQRFDCQCYRRPVGLPPRPSYHKSYQSK